MALESSAYSSNGALHIGVEIQVFWRAVRVGRRQRRDLTKLGKVVGELTGAKETRHNTLVIAEEEETCHGAVRQVRSVLDCGSMQAKSLTDTGDEGNERGKGSTTNGIARQDGHLLDHDDEKLLLSDMLARRSSGKSTWIARSGETE